MIRTRFAPSPTGRLHLGNARTALFNALHAARTGGVFLLRIEDTDAARSVATHAEALLDDLRWLGIEWSEGPDIGGRFGPYRQSERGEIHAESCARLLAEDHAYPCFCKPEELAAQRSAALAAGRPPRYPGTCAAIAPAEARRRLAAGEAASLRFRIARQAPVAFDDLVRGPQRLAADELGDFVIRRSDGSPAFLFANALDDAFMEITDVLRGEDHLANTPRQLLILEALALPAPRYGHLPLVVDASGKPLSKREAGISLAELRGAGILPEALANYLFRLGHACARGELLDAEERVEAFAIAHLGRAPAQYDPAQLAHWQRLAIPALDPDAALAWYGSLPVAGGRWAEFWNLLRGNVASRDDLALWAKTLATPPDRELVVAVGEAFRDAAAALCAEPDYRKFAAELRTRTGLGGRELYAPLRLALTGRHDGPELARLWVWFRAEERCARLRRASEPERRHV
ncbi:MAG TPA: glutamate--tRNA ligase [Gammaproteobacteria bacterium]|nr:glutamate--tRNA ligase [Gammaproteobacteria bacterium]